MSDTPELIRQHGLQGQVWPIANQVLDSVQADTDSMDNFRSSLKSSSILPVPRTTQHSGSSAIETGSPVSSRMRLSRSFNTAPPPVSTMPRSLMSAESPRRMRPTPPPPPPLTAANHSPT